MRRCCTNMPEVVADDVRYCGKSELSADVEFPAEFDPKRTCRRLRRALWRLKNAKLRGQRSLPAIWLNVPCTAFASLPSYSVFDGSPTVSGTARSELTSRIVGGRRWRTKYARAVPSIAPGRSCFLANARVMSCVSCVTREFTPPCPGKGTAGQVLRGPRWPKGEPRPR